MPPGMSRLMFGESPYIISKQEEDWLFDGFHFLSLDEGAMCNCCSADLVCCCKLDAMATSPAEANAANRLWLVDLVNVCQQSV